MHLLHRSELYLVAKFQDERTCFQPSPTLNVLVDVDASRIMLAAAFSQSTRITPLASLWTRRGAPPAWPVISISVPSLPSALNQNESVPTLLSVTPVKAAPREVEREELQNTPCAV